MRNYDFNKVERTRSLEESHNRTPSLLGSGKAPVGWGSPPANSTSCALPMAPPGSTQVSSPPDICLWLSLWVMGAWVRPSIKDASMS